MRRYLVREENELDFVKCNKCGKNILVENGIVKEGLFSIDYNWGYFSEKDGEVHSIDLCEKCYDKMIKKFAIMPDILDNNELI